jgi:hypothetical protein
MGEIQNTGEEENVDQAENGAEDQDESQNDSATDEQESEGDDTSEGENTENSDEEEEDKTESKPTQADEEPKVRKRNVDFILERKNRKIEKLKNKEDEETHEDDEDDDIDPDDAKIIQKQVAKALSPFLAKQMEDEDQQEIQSFVKDNPDFAPYIDKVKTFAKHPSRKDLPIQSIFYEVAGPDLLKIGAKRAQKANDEAKESSAGGGSSQGGTSEKSIWDLTPEEFAERQEALRQKPRE